jgi:hypothetical protein
MSADLGDRHVVAQLGLAIRERAALHPNSNETL